MSPRVFGAVDLGASSGRVIAGIVDDDRVELDVVHRFPNGVVERDGHLRWDIDRLEDEVLFGLTRLAGAHPQTESVGIDTWGVDYVLLDAAGTPVDQPIAYRDPRTSAGVVTVHGRIAPDDLSRRNGLQFLPFNTIYQLAAEPRDDRWERVATVALLPDFLAQRLTGRLATEYTNASTTGLLDVGTAEWSEALLAAADVGRALLPPIQPPGTVRGPLLPAIATRTGLSPATLVTSVASHDTASAVAAVPATGRDFAYVSSGTWSLVGVELDDPVVTDAARAANFTNEGGLDDRVRFLRNVGGFWLVEQCRLEWERRGVMVDVGEVFAAAEAGPVGPCFDVDAPELVAPGDMATRIAALTGGTLDADDPVAVTRSVVDSLAAAYARTVEDAARLSGSSVDTVHVVGGGARNGRLCRRTAALTGRPVVAGPLEATALGNVLVQARAHGAAPTDLDALRSVSARSTQLRRFEPDAVGADGTTRRRGS